MKSNATIFLVDDDESVRKAMSRLLRSAGYECETFDSAEAFLLRKHHPDMCCLVLDLRMPHMTGLELQERLERLGDQIPVIFLTGHGDIPQSVQAMKHGAVNFLTKPVDEEVLLSAIEEALRVGRQWLASAKEKNSILQKIEALTAREMEVMRGVIAGALNKQIASQLGIVEKTVKVHRAAVMEKMGVRSVPELVRLCETVGIKPAVIR